MITQRRPLPAEYKRDIPAGPVFGRVNNTLDTEKLNTICVSGKCPNRGECFSRGSLAFMILGDTCTRHCGFCAVKAGNPQGLIDWDEPARLGRAVAELALRHVVVTSVARDDLSDGGATVFAACIRAIRDARPSVIIEVLTPDFWGKPADIDVVTQAAPDIYNHNIETVRRLTPGVRSKATYDRSLSLLRYVKDTAPQLVTKSGLMLGLGETHAEIDETLRDLRTAGCEYLTIGQYLQPSARHLTIQQFVPLEEFHRWRDIALERGFKRVASGPLVRSSYFAEELHHDRNR